MNKGSVSQAAKGLAVRYQARLQAARIRRAAMWAAMAKGRVDRRPVYLGRVEQRLVQLLADQAKQESCRRPHSTLLGLAPREKADLIQDLGPGAFPEEIREQVLAEVDAWWRSLGAGA